MPKRAGSKNRNRGRVDVVFRGKLHIVEQRVDGLHIRVRYGREGERVISFDEILGAPAPRPDEHHKLNGKTIALDFSTKKGRMDFCHELLCAAEDLKAIARELSGAQLDPTVLYPVSLCEYRLDAAALRDAAEQVRKAYRLMRSVTEANLQQQ